MLPQCFSVNDVIIRRVYKKLINFRFNFVLCVHWTRRCRLTDFGFTLASIEILFINMSRRCLSGDNPRASLDFNSFCEALLIVGQKKCGASQKYEPIDTLLTILRHCEANLDKSKHVPCRQRIAKPARVTQRALQSCFQLPTNHPVREGFILWETATEGQNSGTQENQVYSVRIICSEKWCISVLLIGISQQRKQWLV